MVKQKWYDMLADSSNSGKHWRRMAMGLGVILFVQSIYVHTLDVTEKTIIVPPGISKENALASGIWVKGDELGPAYLEKLGLYYVTLFLTYQPTSAPGNFQKILMDTAPNLYARLRPQLANDAKRIKRYAVSSAFIPTETWVRGNDFFVTGRLSAIMGTKMMEKGTKTFRISFGNVAGKVAILQYDEVLAKKDGAQVKIIKSEDSAALPEIWDGITTEKSDKEPDLNQKSNKAEMKNEGDDIPPKEGEDYVD